jgi:hypothetical protein
MHVFSSTMPSSSNFTHFPASFIVLKEIINAAQISSARMYNPVKLLVLWSGDSFMCMHRTDWKASLRASFWAGQIQNPDAKQGHSGVLLL